MFRRRLENKRSALSGLSRFILVFLLPTLVVAAEQEGDSGAKEVSGMSILGNNDAPKALYIVPWKSSEIGMETNLKSSLLNEDMVPVDKPVFMRELEFYKISNP